jgi:formylglycine-generating enzyme required for sulfatase activity
MTPQGVNEVNRPLCLAAVLATGFSAMVAPLFLEPSVVAQAAQATELKPYVEKIAGSDVKFEMLPIPGGTFVMGSPESEEGRKEDEGPQHEVIIKPFWMGKCEVTWDEFDFYAQSQQSIRKEGEGLGEAKMSDVEGVTRPTPPYTDMTFGYGHRTNPAICMSHHAAMEYCRWLSGKTGKPYRLPTEAEWEYACRAGTKTACSFGDDPSKLDDYAWYAENSDFKPRKVGQKKPNPWGLLDMHGNVAEWVIDHYSKDFYQQLAAAGKPALQPVLVPTEKKFAHVVRGGSWDEDAAGLRSAARRASNREWLRQDPQRPQSIWWLTDAEFVGFRVVRPVEEQENLKGLKSKVKKL